MSTHGQSIGIFYEHPHWFAPLFARLQERGTPFVRINASQHQFDPAHLNGDTSLSLVFNRMSPSAYRRGHAQGIFYTHDYLAHLEQHGTRVINGSKAFRYETSKAQQLSLLSSLGLAYPKARVINSASQATSAADGLRFPVILKPNVGGSGAGIRRFNTREDLAKAADAGDLDLGLDNTALVQEFAAARGGHIVRVEVLGGKYLYAIKVFLAGDSYDLCPADICKTTGGQELVRGACPVDAPKSGLTVEGYTPPQEVIDDVECIMAAAGIDVGGVEYLIDARDGQRLYYDINALSNFVADGERVIGFDPYARLADYLAREAQR